MNITNYKDKLKLSKESLDDYPEYLHQDFKKYEFLDCIVFIDDELTGKKVIRGKFKGFIKENNTYRILLYKTTKNYSQLNKDGTIYYPLINKLSYSIFHDTRCKFEIERVYGIERNDTTIKMYINMCHIYCDLLLLIYWFHWREEGMVTDIVYNIHNFLKGHHDCNYNLIWDNKTHYKYLFN